MLWFLLPNRIRLIKSGRGNGPVKPGNLREERKVPNPSAEVER